MSRPRVRRTRDTQSGFTLIEILVSLVLATVAMIGVIALYRAQTNASSFSRRTTEATILAQDKLERLRASALSLVAFPQTETTLDETGKSVVGGPFTRTSNLSAEVFGTETVWKIRVDVQWTEEGTPKTVTVNGKRKQ